MAATTKAKAVVAAVLAVILLGTTGAVIHYVGAAGATKSIKLSGNPNSAAVAAQLTRAGGGPGVAYNGIVRGADGQPVARAEVLLGGNAGFVEVNRLGWQQVPTTKTDSEGRFTFSPQPGVRTLVVRCTAGYAEVPADKFKNGDAITIEPWARIEGIALSAGQPVAGRVVSLNRSPYGYDSAETMVTHDTTTTTNSEGRFTFPRIAPHRVWWIGPQPHGIDNLIGSPTVRVESTPGQTTRVTLGAGGRSIIGRINADPKEPKLAFSGWIMPKTPTAATQLYERRFDADIPIMFRVATDIDGTFRANDVPPGKYVFDLQSVALYPGGIMGEQAGQVKGEFTVPALSATAAATQPEDQVVEVGSFQATASKRLKPGDPAPPFHAFLPDGKELTLADFAGKYLVLRINSGRQAIWYDQPADFDVLQDRFSGSGRVAFLAISLGADAATAAPVADPAVQSTRAISWQKATAKSIADLGNAYANSPVPMFVIDPDGKLLTKWVSARGLLQVLSQAVLKNPFKRPGVNVTIEHNGIDHAFPSYSFQGIPTIDANDAGKDAVFSIVDGSLQEGSGGVAALNDGVGASSSDDPKRAMFFAYNSLEGRFKADLGRVMPIERISSFSWHNKTRCAQLYRLYGSDGTSSDFNGAPKIGTDPTQCGWTLIADVDTRRPDPRGQDAVSITGSVGSYRYLLFATFATESNDPYGQTFFNEIDILKRK